MKSVVVFFFFVSLSPSLYSQVAGCTDPLAANYNASATGNNGSCLYATTSYTPIIKVDPLSDSVIETSGLQMAGGYLWTFNDRGGKASLYRIDSISNNILQRVILQGATNIDWEDIAFDGTHFYIGDFGNNETGGRTDLKIYKFPFSAIHDYSAYPADTIQSQEIEIINFIYSDQPQPAQPSGSNNSKFDCEAMIVDNDKIHLFSKNWVANSTTHYIISNTAAGNYTAMPVETFAAGYLVTAADKVAGQDIIVLLGYQNSGTGNHYMHILSGYKADSFFTGNKRRIDLPDVTTMGQSEGITFRNDKYGYISNEKFTRMIGPVTFTVNQKLRAFDIGNFVGNYFTQYTFTGNGNWSDVNNWLYKIKPPVIIHPGNEIIIDPVAGGSCELDINYVMLPGTKLTVKTNKIFLMNGNLIIQ